jgi:hypothetical protein
MPGEVLDWLQTYDRDLRSRWDYDMTQRSHRRLHEIDGWPH